MATRPGWRKEEATSVPANPSAPARIRRFLRLRAAELELPEDVTADLLIAVSEAVNNALQHTLTPTIECRWRLVDGFVGVEIRDLGTWPGSVLPELGSAQEHWGFRLMGAVVDDVTVRLDTPEHPGTSVQFLKALPEGF